MPANSTLFMTAVENATGNTRSAVTDGGGFFVLLPLPASTYDIQVELNGFAPKALLAQTLHVGTTVVLDFSMNVAGVTETVEVRAGPPMLETSKNTVTRVVEADEIDALPVVGRSFNDPAALAPGVIKTGVYGGVDISGGRS